MPSQRTPKSRTTAPRKPKAARPAKEPAPASDEYVLERLAEVRLTSEASRATTQKPIDIEQPAPISVSDVSVVEGYLATEQDVDALKAMIAAVSGLTSNPTPSQVAFFTGRLSDFARIRFEGQDVVRSALGRVTSAAHNHKLANPHISDICEANALDTIDTFLSRVERELLARLGVQDPPGGAPYLSGDNWERVKNYLASLPMNEVETARVVAKQLAHLADQSGAPPLPEAGRLHVKNGPSPSAVLDGISYPISSSVADFFDAAIAANGFPVSLQTFGVRTRDLQKLPKELRDLVSKKRGGGTWIPRDRLWLS
jgi:hypothetical protein